jgi:hypothetical protein
LRSADGLGPVLDISGPVTVTIRNLTITNGSTEVGGGIDGFYSSGSPTINVIASKVTGNAAFDGGGLDLFNASAAIDSSTFSGNTAKQSDGGGISSFGSDLQITNSRVVGNLAYGYGGGIDFGDPGGGEGLRPNASTAAAHHHGPGSAHIRQAKGVAAAASPQQQQGPGIPFGLTIMNSTIDHNQAVHFGGGGIENYAFESDSPMTIMNTTISNNNAPGNDMDGDSGGGGIHQDSGFDTASATITGSKLYGNTALNSMGGGISNIAYGDGGALLSLAHTSLQSPNALSPGNQAKWGGGIYNAMPGASASLQAGTSLVRNKATVNGGGIFNDCAASLLIGPTTTMFLNAPQNVFMNGGCLIPPD